MTRAELEAAAKEKYPHYVAPTWDEGATKEDVVPSIDASWQNAEADMQRAAYVQGRLDQAEADARIAETDTPWSIVGHPEFDWERVMASSIATERERIAATIRKGVQ